MARAAAIVFGKGGPSGTSSVPAAPVLYAFLFLQRMKTIAGRGSPLLRRMVDEWRNRDQGASRCWSTRPDLAIGGAAFPKINAASTDSSWLA